MHEYVGAFHVHSCYSDGSGTYQEIASAAARAGLDFVVMSDHDTLRPRADGWQGWHDGVLVIVGTEISCKRHCHVVALRAKDAAGLRWKPLRRVLFDLANQGSAAFVAHAHVAHIWGFPLKAGALEEWEVPGFAGVELWSFMHDICDGLVPWQIPSFLYTWRRRIRGPGQRVLAHYDRITQARRFAAVGSLDNHAIAMPVIGTRILAYETGFRTLRTHVLCEELKGEPQDTNRVVQALADGSAFLALDLAADARGFEFRAERGGEVLSMGEERLWQGPVVFRARSPAFAHLTLKRNGSAVAEADGNELEHRAEKPGVYRLEAHLDGRPWVYTNPIYLRPAGWTDEEQVDDGRADL